MAVEVKLPRLGQGMESGTIVRWLKSEGDAVSKGEPLYELDTDKVTQEVEAETDGVLLKIVVSDGEADVGTTVGVIGAQGEDVSGLLAGAGGGDGGPPSAAPAAEEESEKEEEEPRAAEPPSDKVSQGEGTAEAPPAAASASTSPPTPAPAPTPTPTPTSALAPAHAAPSAPEGRVKASPLARRIARERGVELASVTGTGPDGRIVAEDIEKAAVAEPAVAAPAIAEPSVSEPAVAAAPSTPAVAPADVEVVQLTSIRRTIARRLTEAWEAPVFQLTVTANAAELAATRGHMVELLRDGETKPTVSDVLTRLVASALMRHRSVNAHFVNGEIHRYPSANVGIAVATPNGLVVPVIRDANRKSVQEIAAVRADLVARARDGKLQLADLEDGTFTISNLGMYGIEQFVAVLNPPQVAILAVGSIDERPLVVDGELEIAPTMTMTLTCDHRAIDGSEGAEFLRTVKALVESPELAL